MLVNLVKGDRHELGHDPKTYGRERPCNLQVEMKKGQRLPAITSKEYN